MGLILLTCSMFLLVSGLHFIVCSSIDTPLYLFDPWPAFYHCLLCVRRFLAKSHVHMPIYAGFCLKVAYICLYTQVFVQNPHTSSLLVSLMLWEVVGWVVSVVGSSLGLMLSIGCFFCDHRLPFHWFFFEVSLVIYPFSFAISALLFFFLVSCWAYVLYLLWRLRFLDDFYCIFHSFILKNTK